LRGKWPSIPLDDDGDPAFGTLKDVQAVFSDDDICLMCNRALYQAKYMREHHARYYETKRDERNALDQTIADQKWAAHERTIKNTTTKETTK
jgi:hypothetical protein